MPIFIYLQIVSHLLIQCTFFFVCQADVSAQVQGAPLSQPNLPTCQTGNSKPHLCNLSYVLTDKLWESNGGWRFSWPPKKNTIYCRSNEYYWFWKPLKTNLFVEQVQSFTTKHAYALIMKQNCILTGCLPAKYMSCISHPVLLN